VGVIYGRETLSVHIVVWNSPKQIINPNKKVEILNINPYKEDFKRGEYQDREEDFYDQYIENQQVDDNHYPERKTHLPKTKEKEIPRV
jgi:hypothetical protein